MLKIPDQAGQQRHYQKAADNPRDGGVGLGVGFRFDGLLFGVGALGSLRRSPVGCGRGLADRYIAVESGMVGVGDGFVALQTGEGCIDLIAGVCHG